MKENSEYQAYSGSIQENGKEPELLDYFTAFGAAKESETIFNPETIHPNAFTVEFMQPGDALVVEAKSETGHEKGYVFKVENEQWQNLGLSGVGPSKLVEGTVDGLLVPDELKHKSVYVVGSGAGGSAVLSGVVATGRQLYLKDRQGNEYQMPVTTDIGVLRKDKEGSLYLPNLYEDRDAPVELKEKYTSVKSCMRNLFVSLGFDHVLDIDELIEGKRVGVRDVSFEDEDYACRFQYQPHTGAETFIISKRKQKIVYCKSCSPGGEQVLQVSEIDIKDNPSILSHINDIEDFDTSTIHTAGSSFVTHTVSSVLGLDACVYKPNEANLVQDMEIPSAVFHLHDADSNRHIDIPEIMLVRNHKENQTSVTIDPGMSFVRETRENPTLLQMYAEQTGGIWNGDGAHMFKLGTKLHKVRSAEQILSDV